MVDECERRTRERWCGMTQLLLLYRITIPSSNVYRSSRWRRSNCVKIFASFQRSLLKFNAIIARPPPPLIDFEIIAGKILYISSFFMKKKFDSRQLVGQLLDKLEFSIGFESTLEVKSLRKKWIPTEEKFKGRSTRFTILGIFNFFDRYLIIFFT